MCLIFIRFKYRQSKRFREKRITSYSYYIMYGNDGSCFYDNF